MAARQLARQLIQVVVVVVLEGTRSAYASSAVRSLERVSHRMVDLCVDPAAVHEGRQRVEVGEQHQGVHYLRQRPVVIASR